MKEHYCGESPFGNGPDNGCRIRTPAQPQVGSILADYRCSYTENPYTTHCEQEGQPSPDVAKVLLDELSKIGLPRGGADGQLFFTIWTSNAPDWTLAEATYSRRIGLDLESCKVSVIIDQHD